MSNYNHTRFGRKLNALGSTPFLQGLTLRTLFVLLVGILLGGLALTADLDFLLKAPLTAIPVVVTLAFIAIRPNDRPLEEFLANWLRFSRSPQASVFKGHRQDEPARVQVDPQGAGAAAIPTAVPMARPAVLVQAGVWERLSLAGVLIGFWLVTFTSVVLIMLIRGHAGL